MHTPETAAPTVQKSPPARERGLTHPHTHEMRVGVSLRDAHLVDLWRDFAQYTGETGIGVCEIVAERWMDAPKIMESDLRILRHIPTILHSLDMSLGTKRQSLVEKWRSQQYLKKIKNLVDKSKITFLSDHLCMTRSEGIPIGHLTPIPASKETCQIVVENCQRVQDILGISFAVENIAALARPRAEAGWSPWHMLAEVAERANIGILLDLENMYADSINFQDQPDEIFALLPLERITAIHLAGGRWQGKRYIDTHGGSVSSGSMALLKKLLAVMSTKNSHPRHPQYVIIERDQHVPELSGMMDDVKAVHQLFRDQMHDQTT